jgi:3-oxoacyl-[acyl-carrier protein] reductase
MTPVGTPLSGQIALVTGAGRGIGRAIALAYAHAGAHVVVAARTSSDLDAVVADIEAANGVATAVRTDVTVPDDVERLFHQIDEVGGLDLAVLNAGGLPGRGPVADADISVWNDTLALNLTASYLCARAAIPRLRARGGGKIILVGSGIGHRGVPEFSAYACAKAGQWMLTRVLAQELQSDAISVNELIPGPVRTDIGTADFGSAGTRTFAGEWSKLPDDVVPLALLLATQPNHGPSAQSFSLMRRDN